MKNTTIITIFIAFSIAILFSACKPQNAFENKFHFEDNNWNRFKSLVSSFTIENAQETEYAIMMSVKHSSNVQGKDLFFDIITTSPEGEERIKPIHFWLRDKNKSFKGVDVDGVWTVKQILYKPISFDNLGEWKIEIDPRFVNYDNSGIFEVTLWAAPITD